MEGLHTKQEFAVELLHRIRTLEAGLARRDEALKRNVTIMEADMVRIQTLEAENERLKGERERIAKTTVSWDTYQRVVAECDVVRVRIEAELNGVLHVVQKHQPAGSPIPGDSVTLTEWVFNTLRAENERLKAEVEAGEMYKGKYLDTCHKLKRAEKALKNYRYRTDTTGSFAADSYFEEADANRTA